MSDTLLDANHWLNVLKENRLFDTQEKCDTFNDALTALAQLTWKKELLTDLFLLFDDDSKHIHLSWNLIHFIEAYSNKFGIEDDWLALIRATPELLVRAKDWLELLYIRRLNHKDYRKELKRLVPTLEHSTQQQIKSVFVAIINNDENDAEMRLGFETKIAEVLG